MSAMEASKLFESMMEETRLFRGARAVLMRAPKSSILTTFAAGQVVSPTVFDEGCVLGVSSTE